MARDMGVDTVSFMVLHKDMIKSLQWQFGEYMKDLECMKSYTTAMPVPVPGAEMLAEVSISTNGFPILLLGCIEEMKKEELENMMHTYLSAHYGV